MMSTWLVPRTDLTTEQLRMVELPVTAHRVIFGLPGSGKTQVLVHRAAYLRDRYGVANGKYRVFILTNVLRDYIRSGVSFLELPDDSVCTFDSWCVEFYRDHIFQNLPRISAGYRPDFLKIKRSVLQHLGRGQNGDRLFDFILVDEGQDMIPESFEILRHIARHVTVFADYQQQIYEGGANDTKIFEALNLSAQSVSLLGTYRNSPDVALLAAYFIKNDEKRSQYLAQIKNNQCERERPLLYIAQDFDDEMDRLVKVIQQRQVLNQRIGIIVPQNKHVFGLAKGLEKRGITVEKAVPPPARTRSSGNTYVQFDNMTPKIANYHSAKGLTFDCVLLPRFTERSFGNYDDDLRARLLFVGMARATQWVYVSTVEGDKPREMKVLEKAEQDKRITFQRYSATLSEKPTTPRKEEIEDEFSLL
jgi:superfamily I DNA/RNA helicase